MEGAETVILPSAFEDAEIEQLVLLIADMVERLMTHNDRIPLLPESLTRFHSRSPPGISVLDYLRRIVKFTNVEKSCLLMTLYCLDQIYARKPLFTLTSLTCHRFIITSITVTSKGLCDAFCPNSLYAKVGGISVTELNILEREFLSMIEWRLKCTREILQEYYVNLVRTHRSGRFIIMDGVASSNASSTSDSDDDVEMDSSPPSPQEPSLRRRGESSSAIMIDSRRTSLNPDLIPKPTIEQNMAFAALQQEKERGTDT